MSVEGEWGRPGRVVYDKATDEIVCTWPHQPERHVASVGDDSWGRLSTFMNLVDEDDPEQFAAFAQAWGALGLCPDHLLPRHHDRSMLRPALDQQLVGADPVLAHSEPGADELEAQAEAEWTYQILQARDEGEEHPRDTSGKAGAIRWDAPRVTREPVSRWREFSAQAKALNAIAHGLHKGRVVLVEEWEPLDNPPLNNVPHASLLKNVTRFLAVEGGEEFDDDFLTVSRQEAIRQQRHAWAYALGTWLAWGDVRTIVSWGRDDDPQQSDTPRIVYGVGDLFGSIAVQLALGVGRQREVCANCSTVFFPENNAPDAIDGKRWCSSVSCKRVRDRKRQQRHRARKKTEKEKDQTS